MDVKVIPGDITALEVDALIVNLFEGVKEPGGATGAVNRALDGIISQLIASGEIRGKLNQTPMIHTQGKIAAKRVVVAGLGKQEELSLDRIRGVMASACRFLRNKEVKRAATIVHGAGVGGIQPRKSAQAIAEGAILGLYRFRRHMTKKAETGEVEKLLIVERDESRVGQLEEGCARGKVLAEATNFARDMVNEPANFMTPSDMAETARRLAAERGLECTVLEQEQMRELSMGALLGVAQGSQQPPKFIILKYRGGDASQTPLGLVGKGITFDSGGISLKSSEGMADMKGDMAGGAAVMAALRAIAELKLKTNVTGLVPSTENLPSGSALKPQDVLQAMNGKTIEVSSTDAEGRLILADALAYARKLGISPIVDVATLTGACHVALGDIYTGVFSNNRELADRLLKAAEEAGERMWQLPMHEDFREQMRSEVADIKNTGGRYGGAITAAMFLGEFVEDTPWVHLDIAGTYESDKEKAYRVKGATGVAVRTLVNLASALAEK